MAATPKAGFFAVLLAFVALAPPHEAGAAPAYLLNERIQVSTTGAWDKATIIEVGTAGSAHEGEFKVHFDGYAASYDRWLQPVYFRKMTAQAEAVPAPIIAKTAAYQLNDRIQVNTLGSWDKASIIEIGTAGSGHENEFKVHYDGYAASYDRWLLPVYFRKVEGGAAAATAPAISAAPVAAPTASAPAPGQNAPAGNDASGPRPGKYNINSFGAVGRPPLYLGHIELQAGGKYRVSRRSDGGYYGEGTYSFDAAARAVKWLSGPCKDDGWGGSFVIEREGKTHKITLRRGTVATNSAD
ncbi:MAG: hypothetical protein ABIP20_16040 [Chthoniobacteraceae bacterium]